MKAPLDQPIQVVNKQGKKLLPDQAPQFLATNAVKLPHVPGRGKGKTLVPINMFLPPGISKFFIERLDASHVRFIILAEEVERLTQKANKIMEASREAHDKNRPPKS
jgi:hypothetical protein